MKKLFFYAVLVLFPLMLVEGCFRLLPVADPPALMAVSAEQPVVRYEPNIAYLYSMGWNFAVRTRQRTRPHGLSTQHHAPSATPAACAVSGFTYR